MKICVYGAGAIGGHVAARLERGGAEVSVIALVGERGREVREFLDNDLGPEGLARSVVVLDAGTRPGDDPTLLLRAAAEAASRDAVLSPTTAARLVREGAPLPVPWPAGARDAPPARRHPDPHRPLHGRRGPRPVLTAQDAEDRSNYCRGEAGGTTRAGRATGEDRPNYRRGPAELPARTG